MEIHNDIDLIHDEEPKDNNMYSDRKKSLEILEKFQIPPIERNIRRVLAKVHTVIS